MEEAFKLMLDQYRDALRTGAKLVRVRSADLVDMLEFIDEHFAPEPGPDSPHDILRMNLAFETSIDSGTFSVHIKAKSLANLLGQAVRRNLFTRAELVLAVRDLDDESARRTSADGD